ncbi:MAG TPA: transporter [Candidatus Polarisedimenticolia bacterium]|nr:transporter [Candidatus Polarisedimenticolia bacterium]
MRDRSAAKLQRRWVRTAAVATAALLASWVPARAQSIEPRLFSNAPVGLNFILIGYVYSSGGVLLDPSIPLEDASLKIHAPFLGYARALDVGGKSGQFQVLAPYAWLSGEATEGTTGLVRSRDVNGFGDPGFRFMVNLHGAPALRAPEFKDYKQDMVVGVSLMVTAPLGQYDPDRLVNLGTNRWSFRPEFGVSKALGPWILEGIGAATLFTDNDDFFGGQHRSQDPIYSAQGHVVFRFPKGAWTSFDATYYTGGRTTLDGVESDDQLSNWRYGLTVALRVNRRNSIKLYASDGVWTRVGEDFRLYGAAWQLNWGGS